MPLAHKLAKTDSEERTARQASLQPHMGPPRSHVGPTKVYEIRKF